jgi:hypothetical protein
MDGLNVVMTWFNLRDRAIPFADYVNEIPENVRVVFETETWDTVTACGQVLRGPMLSEIGRLSEAYEQAIHVLYVVSILLEHMNIPRAEELAERVARLSEYGEIQMDKYESYREDMDEPVDKTLM